jgi:hypothetical protein
MLLLGLGERAKSAGAVRIVRRRAAELNLDWSHFRGKRRWSDAQLKQAVAECHSWAELLSTLGLSARSGNVESHIKSHAVRLGLDTRAIAGRVGILLRTYRKYIVGNARGLLGDVDSRSAEVRASA